ncbi:MAG: hypothetical protein ACP5HW_03315 [Candidatus Micrarchaeia archaeon]
MKMQKVIEGHNTAQQLPKEQLYTIGPLYAYSFAASMAILAGLVLLSARSKL